jgi:hypothetical protein
MEQVRPDSGDARLGQSVNSLLSYLIEPKATV